jgi:hypothetical protein
VIGVETGLSVKTNEVPFLVILDIDMNKRLSPERKQEICRDLFQKLQGRGARIVRTAHGGLHVYCNQGDFELASNREIKCYTSADFDLDLFGCENPAKKSMVLLPGSQIRDDAESPILHYEVVDDPPMGILTLEIADALSTLGISLGPVVPGKKGKVRVQTKQ